MRMDKKEAFQLRKQGKTFSEISKNLGVSKGTLSFWFKNIDWSKEISEKNFVFNYSPEKLDLMYRARRRKLDEYYDKAKFEAEQECLKHINKPLFIAGIMLYLGEGDKRSQGNVRIANSDYKVISLFLRFLTAFGGINEEKIRAWLLLYPDLDEDRTKEFWKKKGGLSKVKFNKSMVIIGKEKINKLKYGVCYLGVSNRFLKEKMLFWMEFLPEKILAEKQIAGMVQW